MSAKSTTNFRSYEAQARLLAAVIATAKPKLDYKEIQKLFGESTPQGLEFHFRQVKAIGKAQQEAADNGGDPTGVVVGAAARGKGKGVQRSLPSTPATSRKRATPASGLATTGGRGRKQVKTEASLDDASLDGDVKSDVDSPEDDYDGLDIATPSKPRPRSERNPAYTVNNSTSNSDMSSPAVLQTYAQTQAQIQARARQDPQNQDFFGQQPASEQQRQSIFGGPTPTTNAVAPSVEKSEDELMEIDGAQFSSARKPAKGKGVSAAAAAKKKTTKTAKEPVIKNDPTAGSADGMFEADGLSSVPSLYSTSNNYAFSFGDGGDDYADGEV